MKKIPKPGQILISEPLLEDIHFSRSIVLVVSNDEEGVIGHVINQPCVVTLEEALSIKDTRFVFYNGGPVEPDGLFFVHRCYEKIQSGTLIQNDLYWGGDLEELKILIRNGEVGSDEVKFFLGYAGWENEQLLTEIEDKNWIVTNRYTDDFIFASYETFAYWKTAIENLGDVYKPLIHFPIHPSLN